MRIILVLMTASSMLLVGYAALSRQSGRAASYAGNNTSLPAVDAGIQAGGTALSVTLPVALVAAFVVMGLATLVAVAGGGR